MINFFKMAENDLSMKYLYDIFGSMNGLIPPPNLPLKNLNEYIIPDVSLTMIGMMFNAFNSVMLAIGALIVVYMTVVGVMQTAHEGEFMGKKWNNIWLPIRTVLGVATLVPTSSGYSTIQLVMMWIVIQGIAAADTLWSTTLSARAILGSPYSEVQAPDISTQQNINNIFIGLVCAATTNLAYDNPTGGDTGNYYCKGISCDSTFYKFVSGNSTDDNRIQIGMNSVCANVAYCNPDKECNIPGSMKCIACKKQNEALENIVPTLADIASQLAQADYIYRDFMATSYNRTDVPEWQPIYNYCAERNPPIPKANCCKASATAGPLSGFSCPAGSGGGLPAVNASVGDSDQPDYTSASESAVSNLYYKYMMGDGDISNFQITAANNYSMAMQQALKEYIAQANPENLQAASIGTPGLGLSAGTIFEKADRLGWIMAGTFYYVIAIEGAPAALPDSVPILNVTNATSTSLAKFRNNIDAATALMEAASVSQDTAATGDLASGKLGLQKPKSGGGGNKFIRKYLLKPLTNMVTKALESILGGLNNAITSSSGPINALQIIGQIMATLAGILYLAFFTLSISIGVLAGSGSVVALGNGIPELLSIPVLLAYVLIAPFVMLFIAWMFVTGGMLAVYLPLVPYTIFLFGVIGWFTAVIEAMVAAPLVAIGILSPSGEHELMGKSQAAIGMMLALFLRPSLMVFGMIGAMLLVVVVLSFILSSFGLAVIFITKGIIDPLSLILFISALVFLVISAATKCFSLIHLIPHNVMMWIGIHYTPGDRGETPLEEMKGKISSAAGKSVETGEASGKAATKRAGEIGDARNKAKAGAAKGGSGTITPKN